MKLAKRVTLCRKVPVRFCVSSNFFRWVRAELSTANGLCRVPGCPRPLQSAGLSPGTARRGWDRASGAAARLTTRDFYCGMTVAPGE